MTSVALFPIPGHVNFPNSRCVLHVFEPRYRKMVRDCVDRQLPLAVCHTTKQLSSSRVPASRLANQATFEPCTIFSAGRVEIVHEFEDGRLAIEVSFAQRYRLQGIEQEIPYRLAHCDELIDDEFDLTEAENLKCQLTERLMALASDDQPIRDFLASGEWTRRSAQEASFDFFQLLQLDPDYKQLVLELSSPVARLEMLSDILDGLTQ